MTMDVRSAATDAKRAANLIDAATGLAIVRVTLGAMFLYVFFENLGKGLYTPAGYASIIGHYVEAGRSPGLWKAIMAVIARHPVIPARLQAVTELSLGVLLTVGVFTRPVAFVAFLWLGSLWMSEWGTSWLWELLVPLLAALGVAIGRGGRRAGIDAVLAQRHPASPWW